jgi:hypothetical protein
MIWVLDKYIRTIRQLPIASGPYKGMTMGPTFENVWLGDRADSFQGLTRFGNKAIHAANALIKTLDGNEVVTDFHELFAPGAATAAATKIEKNGDIISTLKNVIYYVHVALTKTGSGGAPMHLPDVGPYWTVA